MASEATPPRLRKRDRVKKAIKRVFRRDQALHGTEVVTSHTATTVPVQLVKTVHDADANSKAESEIKSRTTDDAAAAAAMSTAAHVEDASAQAADGPAQVEEDAEVEDAKLKILMCDGPFCVLLSNSASFHRWKMLPRRSCRRCTGSLRESYRLRRSDGSRRRWRRCTWRVARRAPRRSD